MTSATFASGLPGGSPGTRTPSSSRRGCASRTGSTRSRCVVMVIERLAHLQRIAVLRASRFPAGITLGGWLGGALQWHFAAMWLLVVNGLVYLALNVVDAAGFARKFFPLSPRGVLADCARRCAAGSRTPTRATTTRCSASPTCS